MARQDKRSGLCGLSVGRYISLFGSAPPPWAPSDKAGAVLGISALSPTQFGSPADNGSISTWTDSVSSLAFSLGHAATYKADAGDGYPGAKCLNTNLVNETTELISTGSPFSIFVVYRQIDYTGDYAGIFTFKTSSGSDSPYVGLLDGKFGFNSTGTAFKSWRTTATAPVRNTTNYSIVSYNGAGATSIDNYTYYLNGTQEAISALNFAPSYNRNQIGAYAEDGTYGLDGYVKELWVFNTVMTAEDVANFDAYVSVWGL